MMHAKIIENIKDYRNDLEKVEGLLEDFYTVYNSMEVYGKKFAHEALLQLYKSLDSTSKPQYRPEDLINLGLP